jgi:60 kDa SS-A/Ro ribonucleoprotein
LRTNQRVILRPIHTHEGGRAHRASLKPINQLRRSVLSNLLFEDEFYEDGQSITNRIVLTATDPAVTPDQLASLAIEARRQHHLRHVPLLLCSVLADRAKGSSLVADTLASVIQRADEPAEFLAIRCRVKGVPVGHLKDPDVITHGIRKGLARALCNFDEYQLAKYEGEGDAIKLRDVLRLVRPAPIDDEQSALFGRLRRGELARPNTWESALAGGADKKATFTRLLEEGKLGYFALIRNLRGMNEAGVDPDLVRQAIVARKGAHNILPFRFVAAARAAPMFERELDVAMQAAIADLAELDGDTIVLVDVSGSMDHPLSNRPGRSRPGATPQDPLTRMDAAAALGVIIPGRKRVFTFSQTLVEVPPRPGMAGIDAIRNSQSHDGTYLAGALSTLFTMANVRAARRLIVITDEQTHDGVLEPIHERNYVVNVASAQHGVGYGKYVHVDGFSEHIVRYIHAYENET